MRQTEYMKGWSHAGWMVFTITFLIVLFCVFLGECSAQIQNQHLSVIAKKDTSSGGSTGPSELSGNFTSDAFGFEDGDVDDVWAINASGAVTISVNSSDPIYGSYSCNVEQTSTQSMADRPQILFNTTSNVATSTSHTIRFSIRNNHGSNSISARFMYLGGLVNPTDPVIAAGATEDFEITINSSSTSVAYFGLYIYEGNSYNFDIDIDNVSIKEN